jgi:hypothetical protein
LETTGGISPFTKGGAQLKTKLTNEKGREQARPQTQLNSVVKI